MKVTCYFGLVLNEFIKKDVRSDGDDDFDINNDSKEQKVFKVLNEAIIFAQLIC
jgi:hypothetical protein